MFSICLVLMAVISQLTALMIGDRPIGCWDWCSGFFKSQAGLDDLGAPKCWETSKYDPNGNID